MTFSKVVILSDDDYNRLKTWMSNNGYTSYSPALRKLVVQALDSEEYIEKAIKEMEV